MDRLLDQPILDIGDAQLTFTSVCFRNLNRSDRSRTIVSLMQPVDDFRPMGFEVFVRLADTQAVDSRAAPVAFNGKPGGLEITTFEHRFQRDWSRCGCFIGFHDDFSAHHLTVSSHDLCGLGKRAAIVLLGVHPVAMAAP